MKGQVISGHLPTIRYCSSTPGSRDCAAATRTAWDSRSGHPTLPMYGIWERL